MAVSMTLRPAAAAALLCVWMAGCGGGGSDAVPAVKVPTGTRTVAASTDSDANADNATTLGRGRGRSGGQRQRRIAAHAGRGTRRRQCPVAGHACRGAGRACRRAGSRRRSRGCTPAPATCRARRVQSESSSCDGGGSVVVSADDADNDNEPSAGDTISLTAYGCVLSPALPAANGGFSIAINAVEIDSQQEIVALDAGVTFSAFSLAGYGSMTGAAHLWLRATSDTSLTMRISYQGALFGEAGFDFDVAITATGSASSFELSGGIVVDGATYSVVPVTGLPVDRRLSARQRRAGTARCRRRPAAPDRTQPDHLRHRPVSGGLGHGNVLADRPALVEPADLSTGSAGRHFLAVPMNSTPSLRSALGAAAYRRLASPSR